MSAKEAKSRIKINKLLEEAGWRFFDNASGKANVVLEPNVKLTIVKVDALGENFDKTSNGFVDFLLLDENNYPLIVLEAKSEDKNPLVGKEQARKYAKSQNCRFVILSNGNLHYFWDLQQGNPHLITRFPAPDSIKSYNRFQPNPDKLISELVGKDYICQTQMPTYANEAGWKNEAERPAFIEKNRLRFMREYQLRAVQSIQQAVKEGGSRFLFEMATGTGKTLTAAAVIKLFLRTGNARRVLFLVDRLELEDQANKAFIFLLKNDCTSVIYKERRDERDEFLDLHAGKTVPPKRGYALESILGGLSKLASLEMTEPFKVNGEQIDGAVKYDGEHYLIEAKWQDKAASNEAVYQFVGKAEGKMYGRGLFVSINGFSDHFVKSVVTGKAIKTIFVDGEDLVLVLEGHLSFSQMLDRKVKAAQTKGLIYVHPISGSPKIV